jgi:23S rRNA pseudouridine1911/1915/1917 synthase
MKRRTFQVQAQDVGTTLESVVARACAVSPDTARALVQRGAVYVDGRRCQNAGLLLKMAQRLGVVLEEAGRNVLEKRTLPPLDVLFEDEMLIAVNKAAGVHAQPTAGVVGDSLLDQVSAHLGISAGLVHRLDRETTGVTVFGKTPAATSALAAAFRDGTARKKYLAITGPGLPPEGVIDLPLAKDPRRPGRYVARPGVGVPAHTQYTRVAATHELSVVSLTPLTGRTHQLRAHLTALGFPILGDLRYGGAPSAAGGPAQRCLLHAQTLELPHPRTGRRCDFTAPPPEDFQPFLRAAGL